jgi:LDH2 family malate/lactate/ureidoglycolate dehydrogenase
MPNIRSEALKELCIAILEAAGTPGDEAEVVADIVVRANLRGIDSHGVRNIPRYIKEIKSGDIHPGASIKILKETPTTELWDVNNAFGFVAGKKAMEKAIKKAEKHWIGAVATLNSKGGDDHIGALYYYSELAAQKDMIGIAHSTRTPRVAAWGGKSKALAINPISIAVPAANAPPINLDISMTWTSRGHLGVKAARGEMVPEGWILDPDGQPTTDPKTFFEGKEGILIPFGAYKGYGLAVVLEAITGGLGAGCSHDSIGFGHLYAAINPAGFVPVNEFKERVGNFIKHLKASAPRPDVEEVFVPGEIENRTRERRLREGIPVDDVFWEALLKAAEDVGVDGESVSGILEGH